MNVTLRALIMTERPNSNHGQDAQPVRTFPTRAGGLAPALRTAAAHTGLTIRVLPEPGRGSSRKIPDQDGRRWKLKASPDTMVQVTVAGPADQRCNTREDSSDGQPIYQGLEVHDGPVLVEG